MRHPYTVHKTAPRRRGVGRRFPERPDNPAGDRETQPTAAATENDRALDENCALLQRSRIEDEAGRPLDTPEQAPEDDRAPGRRPRQRGIE